MTPIEPDSLINEREENLHTDRNQGQWQARMRLAARLWWIAALVVALIAGGSANAQAAEDGAGAVYVMNNSTGEMPSWFLTAPRAVRSRQPAHMPPAGSVPRAAWARRDRSSSATMASGCSP
jgi:hypothetical protein